MACLPGSIDLTADFNGPSINASLCNFSIQLPRFSFGLVIPPFQFPPTIPFPTLAFALSCDLSKPIDVSVGLGPGGGRIACFDEDPDLEDT